jgi:hypothetical protein
MRFLTFIFLIPFIGFGQTLNFLPSQKLDKVVDQYYYNTEYIYIENNTSSSLNLTYKLVEEDLNEQWSVTLCTNAQCFNYLSESGNLGSVEPGEKAYLSINLSANQAIGDGIVRYAIASTDNKAVTDTVTFKYTVTESGNEVAGPWASIQFQEQSLTIFLGKTALQSMVSVYDINGKILLESNLQTISSFSFRNYPSGIYIVRVRDEKDRVITEKIPHYL